MADWLRGLFGVSALATKKENPNHEPAGSPKGGQFASKPGESSSSKAPQWAGDKVEQQDGYTVRSGRFLNATRWIVDEDGTMGGIGDSPSEAVANHRRMREQAESNQQAKRAYANAIEAIRAGGDLSPTHLSILTESYRNVNRTRVHDILRSLGIPDKDTRKIIGRLGIYGESSGGAVYHSVDEVVKRARLYLSTGKKET